VTATKAGGYDTDHLGHDDGLLRLVRQVDYQPPKVDGQTQQRFEIHDVERRQKREIGIPALYVRARP